MTMPVYLALGEHDPRFDGHRARKHLVEKLAFQSVPSTDARIREHFDGWLARHAEAIGVRRPARILLPPAWYATA